MWAIHLPNMRPGCNNWSLRSGCFTFDPETPTVEFEKANYDVSNEVVIVLSFVLGQASLVPYRCISVCHLGLALLTFLPM
jgi:hypothetical protein